MKDSMKVLMVAVFVLAVLGCAPPEAVEPPDPAYGVLREFPVLTDAELLAEGFKVGDVIQESIKGWRVGVPGELTWPGHVITRKIGQP